MKFAIRDDDLNYFYNGPQIDDWYKEIWNICPVSMSIIPFVMGNWKRNVTDAERRGPGKMFENELSEIKRDNTVYPIGDNIELVEFINEKIIEKKVYVTIHAIHHRNQDDITPQFDNNHGIGAEFYTERDLTIPLRRSIEYLQSLFKQKIEVFTPPQNLINNRGLIAVMNNKLSICGDFPSIKSLTTFRHFGYVNFWKYLIFKLKNRRCLYPFLIKNKDYKIISHQRLQPGSDIGKIYSELERAYSYNGIFVLSTHSYGFDLSMKDSDKSMKNVLLEIIEYAKKKDNIDFVSLGKIFE